MNNYMTVVEKTSERIRSNVIIYNNFYHFAEMNTMDQLEKFSKMLGFTYTLEEISKSEKNGEYKRCQFVDDFAKTFFPTFHF